MTPGVGGEGRGRSPTTMCCGQGTLGKLTSGRSLPPEEAKAFLSGLATEHSTRWRLPQNLEMGPWSWAPAEVNTRRADQEAPWKRADCRREKGLAVISIYTEARILSQRQADFTHLQ